MSKTRDIKDREEQPGVNYVLAIAIKEYKDFSLLDNPIRDVELLMDVLTEKFRFSKDQITLLVNGDATEGSIDTAFKKLSEVVTDRDNLLIIFSGHGDEYGKENYWAAVDTKKDVDPKFTDSNIISYIDKINSKHTLLIVDACFGAGFPKSKSKSGGRVETSVFKKSSRWVITAGGNKKVLDGNENSPFMEAIVMSLYETNEALRFSKMIPRVTDLTAEIAFGYKGFEQIPEAMRIGGGDRGEFVFFLEQEEIEVWKYASTEKTIKSYEHYIHLFPTGTFREEAEKEIKRIHDKRRQLIKDSRNLLLGIVQLFRDCFYRDGSLKTEWRNFGSKMGVLLASIALVIFFLPLDPTKSNQTPLFTKKRITGTSIWMEERGLQWALGKELIESDRLYDEIGTLSSDRIRVKLNGYWGYSDTTRLNNIIHCDYDEVNGFFFHDDYGKEVAMVRKDDKCFFIDKWGKEQVFRENIKIENTAPYTPEVLSLPESKGYNQFIITYPNIEDNSEVEINLTIRKKS